MPGSWRARVGAALIATTLATTLGATLGGCTGGGNRGGAGEGQSRVYPVAERRAAPTVRGELLDGSGFDLAAYRGQVVVVNFWASWCGPCRVEAADLAAVYRATRPEGVAFLGIDQRDDRDKALAFVAAHDTGYPSLFDPAGRQALAFTDVPPNTTPATLVIDRQGRIAAVFRKALLREELEPVVRRIAAEPGTA